MTSCHCIATVCATFGLSSMLLSTSLLGQTPFRVKAGAPADSLVVNDGTSAQIGIGTDAPTTNLHIVSDVGPQIRLHNTSDNITWDMQMLSGGDLVLFNLSTETTPFAIENGANNNSLVISDVAKGAAGAIGSRIGMGTQDPQKDLHIVGDDLPTIRIESTFSGGQVWDLNCEPGSFNFEDVTAGTHPFAISSGADTLTLHIDNDVGTGVSGVAINRGIGADHPLHVGNPLSMVDDGNGAHCTSAGVWTDASSRVHKEQIEPIDAATAAAALEAFEPVTYRSRGDTNGEQYAGFIAEDVPEIVATAGRKGVAAIEVVAVVTRVVQEQQATIDAQRATIASQQAAIDSLQERLADIETMLGKLEGGPN